MVGLLFRVVVGVAAVAVAGGAVYAYRCITKDKIKEEIEMKHIANVMKALIKEKSKNSVKISILDEMDKPLDEYEMHGDEVSSDINVGDVIELVVES